MTATNQFDKLLKQGNVETTEALSLFDELPTVYLDFMFGKWRGKSFPTNHPLDGALEAFNWYGKEFLDADHAHPLVFWDNTGTFCVDPGKLFFKQFLSLGSPTNQLVKNLFLSSRWLFETKDSKARLRMMEYRGKVSATMIYDDLPIHDVFRKVDENRLLGLMDLKGDTRLFFFMLERT
jgi:hypothetical protein